MVTFTILVIAEPWLSFQCTTPQHGDASKTANPELPYAYPNPDYPNDPCRLLRTPVLLGLNREECSFGRRLLMAALLGGVIGWERRQADRPAGIRTMALVSVASCLFTIASAFAFRSGPQGWDASRISAAIPSGVGFLGAGMIFKDTVVSNDGLPGTPVVHGLTTAASLWMSAAVGIACGGELYFASAFTCAILLVLLRFGPRITPIEEEEEDEQDRDVGSEVEVVGDLPQYGGIPTERYHKFAPAVGQDPETQSLMSKESEKRLSMSMRKTSRAVPVFQV